MPSEWLATWDAELAEDEEMKKHTTEAEKHTEEICKVVRRLVQDHDMERPRLPGKIQRLGPECAKPTRGSRQSSLEDVR